MAATSVASAADMAPRYTKAPPAMVEVWNWTGFYIGGNVGYSWGRGNPTFPFQDADRGADRAARWLDHSAPATT